MMISSLFLMFAAEALTPVVATPLVEPDVARMSPRDIKTFNMNLPKSHPFYIRCVASVETGSLVKTNRACKTNQQWRRSDDRGNQDARETYDNFEGKSRPGGQ
jgi:hypothetical protein